MTKRAARKSVHKATEARSPSASGKSGAKAPGKTRSAAAKGKGRSAKGRPGATAASAGGATSSDDERLGGAIALVVLGLQPESRPTTEALVADARRRWNLSDDEAVALIGRARLAILASSEVDRDEQLGFALVRLDGLYRQAMNDKDYDQALKSQRDLTRLLVQRVAGGDEGIPPEDLTALGDELEAVRGHLLPLNLPGGRPDTSAGELARLAVARLVQLTGATPA